VSIIGAVAVRAFAATAETAEVGAAEEARLIWQMDTSIAFPPVATDDLLARMRGLRAAITGAPLPVDAALPCRRA
jgi:hypothetical protein